MVKLSSVTLLLVLLLLPVVNGQNRIVSLAPSLTKMLYLLEANHSLVGCTSYCEIAKEDKVNVVASAVEVNLEKLFVLKPDLVVATSLTKPATIESIQKLGIKTLVLPMPRSYEEICQQLIQLAKPLGKESMAQKMIGLQKQRLERLRLQVPKNKTPRVFFEIGAKPLFTVIPNTFMDDYIRFAGGINIAADMKSGTITRETVLARNPEVIFIVTMGIVGTEEKETWMGYKNIPAAKNKKIFIIDSYKACSPNPVTFVDVVEEILHLLYP